jgi:hypothetical protein
LGSDTISFDGQPFRPPLAKRQNTSNDGHLQRVNWGQTPFFATDWTLDAFGRVIEERRADGTSTTKYRKQ